MNLAETNSEPLKLREAVIATTIVVTACAAVAVCFTAIATCQYVGDTFGRIRKKGGGRHVR